MMRNKIAASMNRLGTRVKDMGDKVKLIRLKTRCNLVVKKLTEVVIDSSASD